MTQEFKDKPSPGNETITGKTVREGACHLLPIYTNAYRFLSEGEIIEETDEFIGPDRKRWVRPELWAIGMEYPSAVFTSARRLITPAPASHLRGDGEAAIIECLAAGQNFVFDPATNFLHADDGTVQGIRYIAEHGDLPQSPWPASEWAIDRIAKLEAALKPFAEAAGRFDGVPVSEGLPQQCWFTPDSLREARAALTAATEGQP